MNYDVVIAGGSVAGLLCAREIAGKGFKVLVIEESSEIGTPEHCSGMVSTSGLEQLGVVPHRRTFNHVIDEAEVFAPNGQSFVINSKKQNIAEVNRRELDKQIAQQAQKNGAEIKVKTSFKKIIEKGVETSEGIIECRIIVDAKGVSSIMQKDRTGVLSSAQYEIIADWIKKGKVEVFFDQEKYPGFFAWVIPSSNGRGKVRVAGKGINSKETLEKFLGEKGTHSIIRKIYAPIWINGPIKEFVSNNVVIIGDAAGQSKPTTAGGIYSCGIGGVFAGQAIASFLKTGNKSDLLEYQKKWSEKFGKEFDKQILARKILGRLNNETINNLFKSITPEIINEISEKDDFDFHTGSIIKLLGVKGSLKTVQTIVGGEIKKLMG